MKNLKSLTIAILILVVSSCTSAQSWKTVYGNKKVVTKERKTDSFTGIKVSSGIDVYLKQGNNETVSVEADENLHEYIITEVRGGSLMFIQSIISVMPKGKGFMLQLKRLIR